MSFDSKAFMKAKFQAREAVVPVPDLADFFDGPAEWRVRGLDGKELGRANEAAARNDTLAAIAEGMGSQVPSEIKSALAELFAKDTPQDIAKRVELIQIGSVDPVCDLDLALKLCRVYPAEFYMLTTKIVELTGKGSSQVKKKDS